MQKVEIVVKEDSSLKKVKKIVLSATKITTIIHKGYKKDKNTSIFCIFVLEEGER